MKKFWEWMREEHDASSDRKLCVDWWEGGEEISNFNTEYVKPTNQMLIGYKLQYIIEKYNSSLPVKAYKNIEEIDEELTMVIKERS